MYNVILLRVLVEFLAMGTQQCVPILLLTYVAVNNVINTADFAVETQQCVLCIVALHMSLTTIRNILRSSLKVHDIFVRFSQKLIIFMSPIFNFTKIK